MKKTFTILFLTIFAAAGFAQEKSLASAVNEKRAIPVDEKGANRNGTIYLKMSASGSELPNAGERVWPGAGLGYRTAFNHHAIDFAIEANQKEVLDVANERVTNFSYTLPKVSYLYYLNPKADNSFYAGAGVAFGWRKQTSVIAAQDEVKDSEGVVTQQAVDASNDVREFAGIVPGITAGYEMNRYGSVKTFVQLDATQPTLGYINVGKFFGPEVTLSAGLGF